MSGASPMDSAALFKLGPGNLCPACLSCAEGVLVSGWGTAMPHWVMGPPGWDLNPHLALTSWLDFGCPLSMWACLVIVGPDQSWEGRGVWFPPCCDTALWSGPCSGHLHVCPVCLAQVLWGGPWLIPLASSSSSLRDQPCSCCSLASRILYSSCWDLLYL